MGEVQTTARPSWLLNPFVLAVAAKICRKPSRVAWVGDYAECEDLPAIAEHAGEVPKKVVDVWGEGRGRSLKECRFSMAGKYLVNHTQRLYVDIDAFAAKAEGSGSWEGWVVNPLPLFTAIGNGRGGGDYYI